MVTLFRGKRNDENIRLLRRIRISPRITMVQIWQPSFVFKSFDSVACTTFIFSVAVPISPSKWLRRSSCSRSSVRMFRPVSPKWSTALPDTHIRTQFYLSSTIVESHFNALKLESDGIVIDGISFMDDSWSRYCNRPRWTNLVDPNFRLESWSSRSSVASDS